MTTTLSGHLKQLIFNTEGQIILNYSDALENLTRGKTPQKSVVECYFESVMLPCGTLHESTLKTLQRESQERLGYKNNTDWSEMLWQRLTWHDAVLWLLLIELKENVQYQASHEEIEMLKEVYKSCTAKDERRFKVIYGLLCLKMD